MNHIGDTNKMVSETPRTDEAQFGTGRVSVSFARQLERELNAANDRIKELERDIDRLNMRILSLKVAGQNVVYQATEMWKRVAIKEWLYLSSSHCIDYHEKVAEWNKAKEDKL